MTRKEFNELKAGDRIRTVGGQVFAIKREALTSTKAFMEFELESDDENLYACTPELWEKVKE